MEMNTLYILGFVICFVGIRAILEELPMWMKRHRYRKGIANGTIAPGHVYRRCVSMELNNTIGSVIWSYENGKLKKNEGIVVFEGYVDKYIA